MIRYNVKVNKQIYQVELEKDTVVQQDVESIESSADICFNAIKAEYDYCVTRAGKMKLPQSSPELFGIIIYAVLLIVAVVSNVGMLITAVNLLKSVRFERLDSGVILEMGLPDEKDTTAVRFIGRLYVHHTKKNNAILEKRYTAFNNCVNLFCVSIVTLVMLALISIFWGI